MTPLLLLKKYGFMALLLLMAGIICVLLLRTTQLRGERDVLETTSVALRQELRVTSAALISYSDRIREMQQIAWETKDAQHKATLLTANTQQHIQKVLVAEACASEFVPAAVAERLLRHASELREAGSRGATPRQPDSRLSAATSPASHDLRRKPTVE
jgi:hypothetical protein